MRQRKQSRTKSKSRSKSRRYTQFKGGAGDINNIIKIFIFFILENKHQPYIVSIF